MVIIEMLIRREVCVKHLWWSVVGEQVYLVLEQIEREREKTFGIVDKIARK